MPSFLSKVFGRKKDDKDSSPRSPGQVDLLGGKFEAVSPTVSPSALDFPDYPVKTNGHGREKADSPFGLFRVKSRPSSPETKHKKLDDLPHLSLNLTVAKEDSSSRVFRAESLGLLTDAGMGEKRLSPAEALVLVKACSHAITLHGTSLSFLVCYASHSIQVSKPLALCTLTGTLHLPMTNAG